MYRTNKSIIIVLLLHHIFISHRYETNIIYPPLYAGTCHVSPIHGSNDMIGGSFCANIGGIDHYRRFGYKGKTLLVNNSNISSSHIIIITRHYNHHHCYYHDNNNNCCIVINFICVIIVIIFIFIIIIICSSKHILIQMFT